ncbi:MAG: isoaspartyl peptidase/L-asparaginase [Candidatus Thalassarchaeaceae archaeon]|nr:isoaspartyl peptidase/L-asparaginase [Candidatus Thalassarchaeaceae archaeon]
MSIPAVVAHGGAGAGPERLANVERAVAIAAGILESGGSAVEAAVEACVVLEDDSVFNAGTGSVFRTDGSVLLDASIQVSDGRMGFVIAMEDTPNPIRVAANLLDEEINGLTGEGARIWADAKGIEKAPVEGRPPFKEATDTVGVIARDRSGSIACATSTGGCSDRPPGRVGDVPLPGCGFWVQDGVGVGATGIGEAITRGMLSFRVAERILDVGDLEASMIWALEECLEDDAEVGIIALGSEGTGHGLANSKNMPWSSWIARK